MPWLFPCAFTKGLKSLGKNRRSKSREGKVRYKRLWKTMLYRDGKLMSANGNETWETGKWHKHDGPIEMCAAGYHASLNIVDAMQYVKPEALALVEVRGRHIEKNDKQVWQEMRIVKWWLWTKEDSVSVAIYAAELVLPIYEKQYPDDKRPRLAIEAAKAWLKDPSEENRQAAAYAAYASYASYAAAASAAAYAASAAAYAASSAAYDAYDASAAAYAAADTANNCKAAIHRYTVRRFVAKKAGRGK
jgi:hypothetical protein